MKLVRMTGTFGAPAKVAALGALAAWTVLGTSGCIARIGELRLYGAAAPSMTAPSRVVEERAPSSRSEDVPADVPDADVCREVRVTPMTRQLDVRRYFLDDAQDQNAAVALLLGTAIGFLAFGATQVNCTGACSSAVSTGTYSMLGLAAIPIGMIIYNAVRAQDSHLVDPVAPETLPGPWHPCR
jgi:hypothetical protein